MNVPPVARILIHPETMLTVTLQYPGQPPEVNAIACRYIVGAIYSGPAPHTTPIVRIAHQCTPKHCLYTPCTITLSNCRTTSYKDRRAADNVLVVR
jgi:hypothetical protein